MKQFVFSDIDVSEKYVTPGLMIRSFDFFSFFNVTATIFFKKNSKHIPEFRTKQHIIILKYSSNIKHFDTVKNMHNFKNHDTSYEKYRPTHRSKNNIFCK